MSVYFVDYQEIHNRLKEIETSIESHDDEILSLQGEIDTLEREIAVLERERGKLEEQLRVAEGVEDAERVLFGGIPYGAPLTTKPIIPVPEYGAPLIGGAA